MCIAKSLLVTLALCAMAVEARGQNIEQFSGSWIGGGQFQGQPSAVEAQFEPVFAGAAWDLNILIRNPSNDQRIFEGRATYVMSAGDEGDGVWVDSARNTYLIEPRIVGGELIVGWGGATMNGRSRYRLVGSQLEIVDEVRSGGDWRAFSTSVLSRVE